jgi:hypothetical protein
MEWLSLAWLVVIAYFGFTFLQAQQPRGPAQARAAHLQRVAEAALPAKPAVPAGKKAKGKKSKGGDAPKGMGGGLEARGDEASGSSGQPGEAAEEVRGA